MTAAFHRELTRALRASARPDGGYPTTAGGTSELEPTTVSALALDREAAALRWLRRRQRPSGGFEELDGRADGPTSAALAALALDGTPARRALDFAHAHRGLPLPNAVDPELKGWGWTADTRSFVEPTARVLLATRILRPSNGQVRSDALRLFEEWQCSDGGWNHGVSHVLDAHLPGYAQTTAIALIALQGERRSFVADGLSFLRRRWRLEPGGLTTAQALVAFRLHGATAEAATARAALQAMAADDSFRRRPLVVAWSALATAPDAILDRIRA